MPGVVVEDWKPKHLKVAKKPGQGVIVAAAKRIAEFLQAQPDQKTEVSLKALKQALGLQRLASETFKLARIRALETVPWRVEGRSVHRLFPT